MKFPCKSCLACLLAASITLLSGCGGAAASSASATPTATAAATAAATATAAPTATATAAPTAAEASEASAASEASEASSAESSGLPAVTAPFSVATAESAAATTTDSMGGTIDKSGDAELQTMIADLVDRYQVLTYTDTETGSTLDFDVFFPENYDADEQYPAVLFMGDATVTGKGAEYQLTQGWGGLIWATDEEQAKHPCIVVVPVLTEGLVDDSWNTSPQVDMIAKLIMALEDRYSIDKNRVYTTGQSGGCMTSMYLNITYPGLFAASLYVSGQWDAEAMRALEDTSFFYVTAEGDEKASAGKTEFEAVLDEDGVSYVSTTMDAQADESTWDTAIADLLAQNCDKNMVQWTAYSVQGGANGGTGTEHMSSFDYAYKVTAIRDWLFTQSN